jgi:hypothetical protein
LDEFVVARGLLPLTLLAVRVALDVGSEVEVEGLL